jgi:hypothetical protein
MNIARRVRLNQWKHKSVLKEWYRFIQFKTAFFPLDSGTLSGGNALKLGC